MKNKQLYRLCETAVLVALAWGLSYIKIEIGALGGSIDFVMVPLFIIAYRNGIGYGVAGGLVFGFIKCLLGGGILAYGAVGVAGLFKEKYWAIELSTFIGCFARFIIHFISGVTIYKIMAPTEIAGMTIGNPVLYSIIYNAIYMLPNTIIAIAVMALLRVPLKKMKKI